MEGNVVGDAVLMQHGINRSFSLALPWIFDNGRCSKNRMFTDHRLESGSCFW